MYDQKLSKAITYNIIIVMYIILVNQIINRDLILQLRMAHFPYLHKEEVHRILKQQQSQKYKRADWKANINNQILEKYCQLRRKQQQNNVIKNQRKDQKQLPYYFIFPTEYNKNSRFSSLMDNIRLQRIKNGYNKKYEQKVLQNEHKNIKRQSQSQLILNKYASQNYLGINPYTNSKNKVVDNQSSKTKFSRRQNPTQQYFNRQYPQKSIKSLSQTNISPSRISKLSKKTIQLQNNSRYHQNAPPSESQISFDNVNRQYQLQTQSKQNSSKKNTSQWTSKYDKSGERPKTQRNQNKSKFTYNREFIPNQSNLQSQSQKKQQKGQSSNLPENNLSNSMNKGLMKQKEIMPAKSIQEYYGYIKMQDYQSIKAQRDYLRIRFIEHLQYRHAKELPYKVKAQYYQKSSHKKLYKVKNKK